MINKELFKSLIGSELKISVLGGKWSIYFTKKELFELTVGKFNAGFILNASSVCPADNFEEDSILLANWFDECIAFEDFLNQVCVLGELNHQNLLEVTLTEKSKKLRRHRRIIVELLEN